MAHPRRDKFPTAYIGDLAPSRVGDRAPIHRPTRDRRGDPAEIPEIASKALGIELSTNVAALGLPMPSAVRTPVVAA
ncbi:hypothetical protein [Mycobacteroides abscessus]|uniref:hypothetical protein n=1 Tax=Mycobacteroides abscessus TaxID=36809 RepID=UPI00130003E0|nr:hypothetical protein [Mycobacteroides abscessus]